MDFLLDFIVFYELMKNQLSVLDVYQRLFVLLSVIKVFFVLMQYWVKYRILLVSKSLPV